MKRVLNILTLLFLITACGKSHIEFDLPPKKKDAPPKTSSFDTLDFTLSASRDYGPSSWNDDEKVAENTGNYLVPEEIEVIAGNSGTGWVTLVINDRKFCFQGNASNNSSMDGDKFVLKHEKSRLDRECHESAYTIAHSPHIFITKGDELTFSINGGGCSELESTCVYTETEIGIKFR